MGSPEQKTDGEAEARRRRLPASIHAAGLCLFIYGANVVTRLSTRGDEQIPAALVGNVGEFLLLVVSSALLVRGTLQAERRRAMRTTTNEV
ncbi:hypothetical protein LNKW23_37720 [Paralimibaculum aggregatum]|uniref:Uncharacterized protein n=1 Tax=Paralimibaculum aggregatum TaxID=3036245 RepID=A0ABQ6LMY5_9RHOB|nr:hypothetical protein [Limibaculum sp. NKW23]GMG84556.1 hypothetical protein LNKW23_37720 [Limibaculum sp. NKW23]